MSIQQETSQPNALPSNSSSIKASAIKSVQLPLDNEGHLKDHQQWTAEVAQQLADTLEVELIEVHYQVLAVVRDFFEKFQHPPATRPLIKYLQKQLPEMDMSNQKLQQLFNTGLVARHVNRIAGLPKPPNCL